MSTVSTLLLTLIAMFIGIPIIGEHATKNFKAFYITAFFILLVVAFQLGIFYDQPAI